MAFKRTLGSLTKEQIIALASYVATALVVIVTYKFKTGRLAGIDWLYIGLFSTVTVTFVFDRMIAFIHDNEIRKSIEMLTPKNIYLECLGRTETAIDWFVHNSGHIQNVQNTVYRPFGLGSMDEFLDAAREVLKGPCGWKDVCFKGEEDKIIDFRKTLSPKNRKKHFAKALPLEMPLIQVMIIRYSVSAKRPDVVLFGWPAPYSGSESLVFKSDNVEVVNYFDKYFIPTLDEIDSLEGGFPSGLNSDSMSRDCDSQAGGLAWARRLRSRAVI